MHVTSDKKWYSRFQGFRLLAPAADELPIAVSTEFLNLLPAKSIVLYQTRDNLQIIHVHVSHFVIYEKNILITLRFVAKTDHLSKSAKLLFYSSQEKHIYPVSLAKQLFKSDQKFKALFFVILMVSLF